ncbi:hypothetical protein SOPP22_03150 [Shewanella sp. OPT22]|nr:hypothetical protein SOPP22_03150 [Shewanella sp. OPT22]
MLTRIPKSLSRSPWIANDKFCKLLVAEKLVKDQAEFDSIFKEEDLSKYNKLQLLQRFILFRPVQHLRPELKSEYFHFAINTPYFDIDPVSTYNSLNDASLSIIAKSAHTEVTKHINLLPIVDGSDALKQAGIKPAGNGLYNLGNTCFMNAALQLFACNLRDIEAFEDLKKGILFQSAKDMINAKYPSVDFSSRPDGLERTERDNWHQEMSGLRMQQVDSLALTLSDMDFETLCSEQTQRELLPFLPDAASSLRLSLNLKILSFSLLIH